MQSNQNNNNKKYDFEDEVTIQRRKDVSQKIKENAAKDIETK